jgi:hypothetical protein
MVHPLMLHEYAAAFRELALEPFERSRLALERNERPASFVPSA